MIPGTTCSSGGGEWVWLCSTWSDQHKFVSHSCSCPVWDHLHPSCTLAQAREHVRKSMWGAAWRGSLCSGVGSPSLTVLIPPDVCVFCGAQLLCGGPLLSMPCSLPAPVGSDMGNLALLGTVLMPRHLPNRTGKQLPGQQATGFNAVHTRSVRHPSSTGGPALQLTAPLSPCGHTHASLM